MRDHVFTRELAAQLRVDSVRASDAAASGHPTSSLSAADLVAVLVAEHLRYDLADPYSPRMRACGWEPIEVDGHDVEAIGAAYDRAAHTAGTPVAIVARTRKGRGVSAVEDAEGAHGKPVPDAAEAIRELGGERSLTVQLSAPEPAGEPHRFEAGPADW